MNLNFHVHKGGSLPDAEEPVKADEVFPKLLKIYKGKDGKLDWRIIEVMRRLDEETTLAIPEILKEEQEAISEFLRREAKRLTKKYTVWVYQKVNGRWVKDEGRTYVGDEETARKYVADVNKHQDWTATSNLPEDQKESGDHAHDHKH